MTTVPSHWFQASLMGSFDRSANVPKWQPTSGWKPVLDWQYHTLDCWGDPQRSGVRCISRFNNQRRQRSSIQRYRSCGCSASLSLTMAMVGDLSGGHREYPEGRSLWVLLGETVMINVQIVVRIKSKHVMECRQRLLQCFSGCRWSSRRWLMIGIPDAMIAENPIAGTISDAEIDIDSDGYLSLCQLSPLQVHRISGLRCKLRHRNQASAKTMTATTI